MQRILEELPPGTQVSASLVWVRVLDEDNEQAARMAAQSRQSPRLRHFYDPEQRAARQMAARLGGADDYAWDVYLVFAAQATWGDEPPQPEDWAHQLDHAAWAPAERRHKGEALVAKLQGMLRKAIVQAGYDHIASKYLAGRQATSAEMRLLDELAQQLPEGARILDAGCGAGAPVTRLLSQKFDLIGVDFSAEQIRLARQMVPAAQFICQDITTLDFPDDSFDAIVSFYTIIHIPRQEHPALLFNFLRMLKQGGLALLCMGADDQGDDQDDFFGAAMYWSHYDTETNLRMVIECGFEYLGSKLIDDPLSPGATHLFILARKPGKLAQTC